MAASVAECGTAPARGARPAGPHRIVRNSMFNLAVQGVHTLSNLAVFVLLVRVLGKEELGLYYLLYALVMAVQVVLEAGTATVLTRRIAQAPEAWEGPVAEAAGLFLAIGLASAAVFLGAGAAWAALGGGGASLPWCAAAGLACAALQVQRFCAGVFRAFEGFGYENAAKVLQGALFAVLIVGLTVRGLAGLGTALAAFAASQTAAALLMLGGLRRRWHPVRWRFSGALARRWLSEAVPLGVGDILRGPTWQPETILLGLLQPAVVVAVYGVAYRPLAPLNFLPLAVLATTFPAFVRLAGGERAALRRAFADSTRLLWVGSLPLAVGVCACAGPLVLVLAGPEYLEAALPMRLVIWKVVLSFLSTQYRFLFTAVGRQRLFAGLVVSVFVVEVGTDAALIWRWGYLGACAGTLLGEVLFTTAGFLLCVRHGIGGVEWGRLGGALLAAAAMGGVLWAARGLPFPTLLPVAALAAGLYLVLGVWLGALRREEVGHFVSAFTPRFRTVQGETP